MQIGKLDLSDMEQLMELYKELVPFECRIENFISNYERIKDNDNYYIAVLKDEDEIVGTAMATCCIALDTNFLVIENVIVKANQRGKGIGSMLFQEIDRYAKEKDCGYSILVSSGFRKEAHKFYEKAGYVEDVKGFRKYYNQE